MRVVKYYTVPSGASDAGTQLLRFLAELDRKQYRKVRGKAGKSDLTDARCLEYHAKRAEVGRSAYQASGTMWNAEYVIALVLKSQNAHDAIPADWLEPQTKRSKVLYLLCLLFLKHVKRLPCQEQTQGMTTSSTAGSVLAASDSQWCVLQQGVDP